MSSMKRWAYVKNKLVQTIVDQETEPTVFLDEGGIWIDVTGTNYGPGWRYEEGAFHVPYRKCDRLEYISMLGATKYSEILLAAKTDVELEIWLEKFRLLQEFNFNNSSDREELQLLVSKNLIDQNTANSILFVK